MAAVNGAYPPDRDLEHAHVPHHVNLPEATAAYKAIDLDQEFHAEVAILSPEGAVSEARLGKQEKYGAHRIGSVTKTFTTFLALKLIHDGTLPRGLNSRCADYLPPALIPQLFEDPKAAENMTLEQLLSHTSGLEYDDHCREQAPVLKSFSHFYISVFI